MAWVQISFISPDLQPYSSVYNPWQWVNGEKISQLLHQEQEQYEHGSRWGKLAAPLSPDCSSWTLQGLCVTLISTHLLTSFLRYFRDEKWEERGEFAGDLLPLLGVWTDGDGRIFQPVCPLTLFYTDQVVNDSSAAVTKFQGDSYLTVPDNSKKQREYINSSVTVPSLSMHLVHCPSFCFPSTPSLESLSSYCCLLVIQIPNQISLPQRGLCRPPCQ